MATTSSSRALSPYSDVLQTTVAAPVLRDICPDDLPLAQVLATALKAHPARPPMTAPSLDVRLQGNLTEFGAWDMGARHWFLFNRSMTWPANADSPWKGASSDGVDILALASGRTPGLLVIEVKSSDGHGANLITGGGSSLESDFSKLFEGPVQGRIHVAAGKVMASLRFSHDRRDLEDAVRLMVGKTPATCEGLKLLGVLVCNGGPEDDAQKRFRAFQRLEEKLEALGWKKGDLSFRTVEVQGLSSLLNKTIAEATR